MRRVTGLLVAVSLGTVLLFLACAPQATDGPRAGATSPREAARRDESRPVPEGHRRLWIEVVDACSGEPLPRAKIRAARPDRPSPHPHTQVPDPVAVGPALWEAFVLEGWRYEFHVHADGYFGQRVVGSIWPRDEGQSLDRVVRLNDSARTILRVVDREGRPVGGARIEARGSREGRASLTDANGCAFFEPFAGKSNSVRFEGYAIREGYLTSRFSVLETRHPITAPAGRGAPDLLGPTYEFMDGGRHAQFDAVVLDRPAWVEGRILTPEGGPAPGVSVVASLHAWRPPSLCGTGAPEGGTWWTTSDADGLYRIEPGEELILLGLREPERAGIVADRPLNWFLVGPSGATLHVADHPLEEGWNRRDWQLRPAPRIVGTVRDAKGAPLAGVELELRSLSHLGFNAYTETVNPRKSTMSLVRHMTALTDPQGRFGFGPIPPPAQGGTERGLAWGEYEVRLPGAADTERGVRVLLGPGSDELELELVLRLSRLHRRW